MMRWFKHMTASADDEKLSRLKDAFGLEGYGFWWSVTEIVAAKLGDDEGETFAEFSPKKWGNSLGISPKKFQMLAEFCANLGLFSIEYSENLIRVNMPNILKYRDEYTERQHKKSGQNRDKLPYRARIPEAEAEAEAEDKNPPLPPLGGDGAQPTQPPSPRKGKSHSRESTGNSKPELVQAIAEYTEFEPLREALSGFLAMRERMRKPMTGEALRLLFRELDKLAVGSGDLKIAILEQSILHSWQGVFALKTASARASPQPFKSFAQQRLEANERAADEAEILLFGKKLGEDHATG